VAGYQKGTYGIPLDKYFNFQNETLNSDRIKREHQRWKPHQSPLFNRKERLQKVKQSQNKSFHFTVAPLIKTIEEVSKLQTFTLVDDLTLKMHFQNGNNLKGFPLTFFFILLP